MKKYFGVFLAVMMVAMMTTVAFATEGTPVGPSDYSSILTAMTAQISVSTIVGVLAAAITAAIGFVFLWWAVRKLLSTFFSGFRKGKASV
jgi:hypothetical protein